MLPSFCASVSINLGFYTEIPDWVVSEQDYFSPSLEAKVSKAVVLVRAHSLACRQLPSCYILTWQGEKGRRRRGERKRACSHPFLQRHESYHWILHNPPSWSQLNLMASQRPPHPRWALRLQPAYLPGVKGGADLQLITSSFSISLIHFSFQSTV